MSRNAFRYDWDCTECGTTQSKHNQWHEGDVCEVCHAEKLATEKKDAIEKMLINLWTKIGIDIPSNFEDIVQFCFEDVNDTADETNWHDGDVAIAFRRWIEDQA
jgi:hypothetical protein